MSIENKKTEEIYKQKAQVYLSQSIENIKIDPIKFNKKREELEKIIRISFSSLPKGSKVFEIGSGDGINAKFIESLGFNITASDIADDFINSLQSQGIKAVKFNALEDDFKEKYFAIFCWRVFVHFTKEDALKIIEKVYDSLEDNGIFIFNAMNREIKTVDSEWVDFEGKYNMGVERFYNYFNKKDLDNMIEKTKFHIENFHTEGGKNNDKWLVYVLKK